jgi:hypothetical protein
VSGEIAGRLEKSGIECQKKGGEKMSVTIEAIYEADMFRPLWLLADLKERDDAMKYSLN